MSVTSSVHPCCMLQAWNEPRDSRRCLRPAPSSSLSRSLGPRLRARIMVEAPAAGLVAADSAAVAGTGEEAAAGMAGAAVVGMVAAQAGTVDPAGAAAGTEGAGMAEGGMPGATGVGRTS